MLTQTYPIGRPTRVCRLTGRELAQGDRFVAALLDAPLDAATAVTATPATTPIARRFDFAEAAWDSLSDHRRIDGVRVLAYWRGTVAHQDAKPRPLLDDSTLEDLFEQTESVPGPDAGPAELARHDGLRFVLGLMMLRRRLLTLEGTRDGVMLVRQRGLPRPPAGPPFVELRDPGLTEASTLSIITELEGGGGAGGVEPAPAAPVTASNAAPAAVPAGATR